MRSMLDLLQSTAAWGHGPSTAIVRTAAAIKAGILWINCHGIPDAAVPFGGYKASGWGRENGEEALLQYTELKSVVAKL